jgi:translation initiation factor 2 beta subunit (eIF-2beta)/eIF-5
VVFFAERDLFHLFSHSPKGNFSSRISRFHIVTFQVTRDAKHTTHDTKIQWAEDEAAAAAEVSPAKLRRLARNQVNHSASLFSKESETEKFLLRHLLDDFTSFLNRRSTSIHAI